MNKQTEEALRTAIEFAEGWYGYSPSKDALLKACRKALQEDALDRMAENARELRLEYELFGNTEQLDIEQLIEKHKGERTYFDHELIGAFFTVQNLENLILECVKKQLFGNSEELESSKCTCSDGPFHYESCPMYDANISNPFEKLGKALT